MLRALFRVLGVCCFGVFKLFGCCFVVQVVVCGVGFVGWGDVFLVLRFPVFQEAFGFAMRCMF